MTGTDGDERERAALARLTANEKECLRRRLLPQTAKEMALDLGISPHAVEKRLKMARAKLGVSSSLAAARLLVAAEGYGPVGAQPAELVSGTTIRPEKAGVRKRVLTGVLPMLLIALLAALPQASVPIPDPLPRPVPPGVTPIEHIDFRPAASVETRAYVEDSFRTMDKDGSGFIERDEAPASGVIDSPLGKAGEQVPASASVTWVTGRTGQAMWISLGDEDSDGRVSKAEYVSWLLPTALKQGVPINWRGVEAAARSIPPRH